MSHPAKLAVWPVALAVVVLAAAAFVRGQEQEKQVRAWEYRLMTWEPEDTVAVFRGLTGEELSDVLEMVRSVADEGLELRANPKLQRAIDVRLTAKLAEVGLEGWEAFWVRETTTILDGNVIPTPSVLLRRRR